MSGRNQKLSNYIPKLLGKIFDCLISCIRSDNNHKNAFMYQIPFGHLLKDFCWYSAQDYIFICFRGCSYQLYVFDQSLIGLKKVVCFL